MFFSFLTYDHCNRFRPEVSVEQTPAEILYQVPVHFKSLPYLHFTQNVYSKYSLIYAVVAEQIWAKLN
jgi:hypothetical protein